MRCCPMPDWNITTGRNMGTLNIEAVKNLCDTFFLKHFVFYYTCALGHPYSMLKNVIESKYFALVLISTNSSANGLWILNFQTCDYNDRSSSTLLNIWLIVNWLLTDTEFFECNFTLSIECDVDLNRGKTWHTLCGALFIQIQMSSKAVCNASRVLSLN